MHKDTNPALNLERAVCASLLASSEDLLKHTPLLAREMFIDRGHWLLLEAALELAQRNEYTLVSLYAALADTVPDAERRYLDAAATLGSSSSLDKLMSAWLPGARRHFVRTLEADLDNRASTLSWEGYSAEKERILLRSRSLGHLDDVREWSSCIDEAASEMQRSHDAQGADLLSTGFDDLDIYMGGLLPGSLVVLAARPRVGKTSLGLQLALRWEAKHPVLFDSLEMPDSRLAMRGAAIDTGTNSMNFTHSGKLDDTAFEQAYRTIKSCALRNIRVCRLEPPEQIESAIMVYRPQVVVLDHLQAVRIPKEYRLHTPSFLGDYSNACAHIAKRHNVLFIVLSQLNRNAEAGKAGITELKGSGGIEENADVVLILDRPEMDAGGAESLRATAFVAKNRYGFAGYEVDLLFDPTCQRFAPWDPSEARRIATRIGLSGASSSSAAGIP